MAEKYVALDLRHNQLGEEGHGNYIGKKEIRRFLGDEVELN